MSKYVICRFDHVWSHPAVACKHVFCTISGACRHECRQSQTNLARSRRTRKLSTRCAALSSTSGWRHIPPCLERELPPRSTQTAKAARTALAEGAAVANDVCATIRDAGNLLSAQSRRKERRLRDAEWASRVGVNTRRRMEGRAPREHATCQRERGRAG
jgi:hypothetical protein